MYCVGFKLEPLVVIKLGVTYHKSLTFFVRWLPVPFSHTSFNHSLPLIPTPLLHNRQHEPRVVE